MATAPKSMVSNTKRPNDLPEFDVPPVIEVVIGVQFPELQAYRTQHVGLLWDVVFKEKFPICLERPPLEQVFETFGALKPNEPVLRIKPAPGPEVPRLWFINSEETELVQIQASRFLHNWRKIEGKSGYPRYEPIRDRFFEELMAVQQFFEDAGIGTIEANQCEVTYINHIVLDDEDDPRSQFHRVFPFWADAQRIAEAGGETLPESEEARFGQLFVIRDSSGETPIGRLHVEAMPANDQDGNYLIRLSLTARGAPLSPTQEGVRDFVDIGREAIVRGFAAITSSDMHKVWGRTK